MIIEFCKEIIASISADIDKVVDAMFEKEVNIFNRIKGKIKGIRS